MFEELLTATGNMPLVENKVSHSGPWMFPPLFLDVILLDFAKVDALSSGLMLGVATIKYMVV